MAATPAMRCSGASAPRRAICASCACAGGIIRMGRLYGVCSAKRRLADVPP